jgi:hypothetical protein
MSTAKTDFAENLLLTWLLTASAATRPTTWFVALHTADPTETGTTGELTPASNGYNRQSVTFSVTGATATNTGLLTFGPCTTTNWGEITHISIKSASTAGNTFYKGALTTPRTINVGDSLTIAISDLSISED